MIRVCAASFSSRVMLPSTYAREALVPTALVGMLLLREARERLGQPGPFPECSAGTCRLCQLRFRDLLPLRHAHLLVQRPRMLDCPCDPVLCHLRTPSMACSACSWLPFSPSARSVLPSAPR